MGSLIQLMSFSPRSALIVKNNMNIVYTLIGAVIWTISLEYFNGKEFFYPLLYAPLIMHFVFDGYFWKKNRYARFT